MSIKNTLVSIYLKGNRDRVQLYTEYPDESQFQVFNSLVKKAAKTEFGQKYGFSDILSIGPSEFSKRVPLCRLDDVRETLQASPTSPSLRYCNELSAKDIVACYLKSNPRSDIFSGKILLLGGGKYLDDMPFWLDGHCARESDDAASENITCICGYPSLILWYMRKALETSGKSHIRDMWPNLELVIGGGMAMEPYVPVIEEMSGLDGVRCISTLSGADGFMAFGCPRDAGALRLMLDNGIYYELVPEEDLHNAGRKAIPLCEAKSGARYAMVVSGCGLWRYVCGHIVEIVSVRPYRIRVVDNIYLISNAFGERILRSQASRAVRAACRATGAEAIDFSVAPEYMTSAAPGRLIWRFRFGSMPSDIDNFANTLDFELRNINADYASLRYRGLLERLSI